MVLERNKLSTDQYYGIYLPASLPHESFFKAEIAVDYLQKDTDLKNFRYFQNKTISNINTAYSNRRIVLFKFDWGGSTSVPQGKIIRFNIFVTRMV